MENVIKHRDIKLVTTDKRRNQLVSEPNYHMTKYFSKDLLAIEIKKIKIKMNKPIYLGFSILESSKTFMYEFWYDYIQPKHPSNAKLRYMDTLLFVLKLKVFMKILLMMLRNGLTHQIMKLTDCFQEVWIKK